MGAEHRGLTRPSAPGDGGRARGAATAPAPAGPVRTCIGCRRRAHVDELVRVTMGADGRLHVGRGRPGRGAWLCAGDAACLRAAVRRRAFGRALRAPVPPAALDALAAELGFGLD